MTRMRAADAAVKITELECATQAFGLWRHHQFQLRAALAAVAETERQSHE